MTDGEKLFAWRMRGNMTLGDVAKYYGYHVSAVQKMEQDRLEMPVPLWEEVQKIHELDVPKHLRCAILRRRAGLTMTDVMIQTGIEAREIGAMERGKQSLGAAYEYFIGQL